MSSIDRLLRPRSIALIGASGRPSSLGGRVTARLLGSGFAGRIYLVNPKPEPIHGREPVPSVVAINGPVDMAILAVPRDAVLPAAYECFTKGVGALVVITAGFKEVDAEGRALEQRLLSACRTAGVRMVGPNCMGLVNTDPACCFDATFSPVPALPGPIGFVSQSGALGVAVLNVCHERMIGFSQFVSMGNKADVNECDLLEAWASDPKVPVITMYLESFADPDRFLAIARRVTRHKPVILVKAGRTAAGARAASSHTGALAGADAGAQAICDQGGVLRVETVDEMLETALVLSRCPLPAGARVAVLTNAGGPGILAVDALDASGLEVSDLDPSTRAKLRELLPREASVANPIDMIASAGPKEYGACLDLLLADPNVDAVIPVTVTPPACDAIDVLAALQEAAARHAKPVLPVFMVGGDLRRLAAASRTLPVFAQPEQAARALADVVRHARWRAAATSPLEAMACDHGAIDALLERRATAGGGYLDPADTYRVLEIAGFRVAPWRVAPTRDEALAAGHAVGFPVVLKATGETLVHKSDVGGVALDLRDEAALARALDAMAGRLVAEGIPEGSFGWLVQAFRPGGREVIVGATRDPDYGPLVMFGVGGRYVEVFRDVRFGVAPITPADAKRMIRSIRGLPLLTGTRGEAAVDLQPALDAIQRVGALVARHPAILELDLNPILLFPEGAQAVAVDARIRVAE